MQAIEYTTRVVEVYGTIIDGETTERGLVGWNVEILRNGEKVIGTIEARTESFWFGGVQPAYVSWSSIGSVDPAWAAAFASGLSEAAALLS